METIKHIKNPWIYYDVLKSLLVKKKKVHRSYLVDPRESTHYFENL